ncbi:MAG: DNA-processing protein DprA [Xanthomonadales bacterium]|nr:DNA-processing protein DprA [Xanthomonadales bacterium]
MSNAWLKIARAPGLNGRRLLELLPAVGGADALCATPAGQLTAMGLEPEQVRALREPDPALLASDQAWLAGDGHHLIGISEPDYPALLQQIAGPPAVLWVWGDPAALWQPQIAMVGSRNPTPGGREHAREFAETLVREGWAITSGLAAGIDVTAHVGALDAGGQTVAVLGTGPDQVYPARNATVAEAIAGQGAVVTELPPGSPPRKQHFPSRNRIIAGLSLGVLVVEAALNSGSLITARLAADQGREVFALPGSLHNPMVKGCHRLIKQGARLAESTADITGALAPMAGELARALKRRLAVEEAPEKQAAVRAPEDEELLRDNDYAQLWSALGHDPITQEQLLSRLNIDARSLSSMLLMLELRGLVQTIDGGRVVRQSGEAATGRP